MRNVCFLGRSRCRSRIVGADIIVYRLRQRQKLRTVESGNLRYARFQCGAGDKDCDIHADHRD